MANEPSEKTAAQADGGSKGQPSPPRLALIQSLEELRARVHRQLDALETLAHARAQHGSSALSEREEQLQQRAIELEHAHMHMKNEAERWERERRTMLEQIEHDRRVLAEAWERLEREQVKNFAVPAAASPPATLPSPPLPTTYVGPTPWPATLSSAPGRDHPVTEEVLRQFQSLRRDVRRNATTASLAG
jgi:hypothetical protein